MPEQKTICLIPIPFTDMASLKKRPVLIDCVKGEKH